MENFVGVRFGISFLLYTVFAKFRSHINLKEDKKRANKPFSQETSCNVPMLERLFALFDIHCASHNPTVVLQSSLKSARITYDIISCNNEATKETGI